MQLPNIYDYDEKCYSNSRYTCKFKNLRDFKHHKLKSKQNKTKQKTNNTQNKAQKMKIKKLKYPPQKKDNTAQKIK